MCLKSKLQSYTIVEILIVLVLTSVVLGIVTLVQDFTWKQFKTKQQITQVTNEIQLLEKVLWKEMNGSIVSIDGDKIVFEKGLEKRHIKVLGDEMLYKHDTIEATLSEIQFFNNGIEVRKGRIDAIKASFKIQENLETTFFVFKRTDAESILN